MGSDILCLCRSLSALIASSGGSKSYILRSILSPELIKLANTPVEKLKDVEFDDLVDTGIVHPDEDNEGISDKPLGTILAWRSSEAMELHGIMNVILCLILVNGRSLPEGTWLRTTMKPLANFLQAN